MSQVPLIEPPHRDRERKFVGLISAGGRGGGSSETWEVDCVRFGVYSGGESSST